MLACKNQRYTCHKSGQHYSDCRCRGRANVLYPRSEAEDQKSDGREGESWKAERSKGPAAAALRAATTSPEATRKLLRQWGRNQKNDDNDGGNEKQDRGQGGPCRRSSGIHAHGGGLLDQGVIRGLGALQQWSAPQWGGQGQPGVAGMMENPGVDAHEAVWCTEKEIQASFCPSAGCVTQSILAAPLEQGEVNHLPGGDPSARPTRHQVLWDPAKDQLETQVLGSGRTP